MKKMNIVGLLLVSCLSTTLYPSQRPGRPTSATPNSVRDIVNLAKKSTGTRAFIDKLRECNTANPLVSWEIEHNNAKEACNLPNVLKNDHSRHISDQLHNIKEKIKTDRMTGEDGIREIQDVLYELWTERQ